MAKKVSIHGKEYARKKLTQFVLRKGNAIAVAHKEAIGFDNGVIVVKMNDGMVRIFNCADDECADVGVILYEGDSIQEQEIIFSDENVCRYWKSLYVYFFDSEGGYLLFANKEIMNIVGVYLESVGRNNLAFLKQKAINISALLDEKLANRIMNMDLNTKDDFSLLEVVPHEW